jgi:hypothetical protein
MNEFSFFHLEKENYFPATISNTCPYADLIALTSSNPNQLLIYGHVNEIIIQMEEFAVHSLWVKTTTECERIPFVYITSDSSIVLVNIPLHFDIQQSLMLDDSVKPAQTKVTQPCHLKKIFDGYFFMLFM